MSRASCAGVLVLWLVACGSTGGSVPTGPTDGGSELVRDAGTAVSDGSAMPADAGASVDGGSPQDGGSTPPDAGAGPDGGTTPADGGPVACVGVDLSGRWVGDFDGEVWFTTQPQNREPVSGNVEFMMSCDGVKYRVTGTLSGDEQHDVRFTGQLDGEVTLGPQPTFRAAISGNVFFLALGGLPIPFTGTMAGVVEETRITNGTWQGQSVLPPAQGAGTWRAARQ